MNTLDELLAQQADIAAKISVLRLEKYTEAVAQAKALISQFGLTQDDLFGGARSAVRGNKVEGTKVPPKYRDPVSGKTWTGRGVTPKWVVGDKAQYLIVSPEAVAAE